MKLGISTYCMVDKLRSGEMTLLDVLQWARDNGCEHVELVEEFLHEWDHGHSDSDSNFESGGSVRE